MKTLHKISLLVTMLCSISVLQAASILTVRDTIKDPNIVYPESYEADIHKMRRNWYLQNYVMLDKDIDLTRGDVPATDAQLIDRLSKMPTLIEMPFNSVVKSYIEMYTQRRRGLVENMLGMSIYYMPIFEEALQLEGVPMELKYLPIIESALNPDAVSRAGATGLWQFMLQTARGLGMEINTLVDERRDPLVSSRMAARYLRQLYDIYGDWSLAIAAYNCGPGNVNKALRQLGEGRKDFWEVYPYLPQETRGYVPSFIAANYVMNYYDKHNISPALARRPIITDTVHVNRRVHFNQISEVLDIPVDALRTLNPQYREDIIPGDIRPYVLILPSNHALCYALSEDSIASHDADRYLHRSIVEPSTGASRISDDGNFNIVEEIKYHRVRKGDTFNSIARKYGVSASSIKRVNGIKTLRRGRTIKIVTTRKVPRPVEETPADESTVEVITATVDAAPSQVQQAEDSAFRSEPGDDEPAEEENPDDISDDTPDIDEPDSVETPESTVAPEPQPVVAQEPELVKEVVKETPKESTKAAAPKQSDRPVYHKIRSGENLYKIAKRNGTTVDKIKKLNPGLNPSKINAGQRIRVK